MYSSSGQFLIADGVKKTIKRISEEKIIKNKKQQDYNFLQEVQCDGWVKEGKA